MVSEEKNTLKMLTDAEISCPATLDSRELKSFKGNKTVISNEIHFTIILSSVFSKGLIYKRNKDN